MKQVFLGLLLVISFSCEKELNDIDLISGEWEWVSSWFGFANHWYTPENTGNSLRLIITSDYTFREYLNDSLIKEGIFTLETVSGHSMKYIDFEAEITGYFYQLHGNDSLELILNVTDGTVDYYHRVQ